jgi:zinc/manganese transport system substrate-binding protein
MILIFVKRPGIRLGAAVVAVALLAASCESAPADDRPLVVVTTTVLGDLVAGVAGDAADVEVLMPIGVDPHDYQPSARQIALIAAADLVVANGLGLEEGLEDAIAGATADGVVVLEVAPLVDPLPFAGGSDLDPHVWLDPVRMADAVGHIADALAGVDPGAGFAERGAAVAADLLAADATIRDLLAGIPEEERLLVTNHEALGYFADRYGFTVIGVVIPGGSTLAEPSSAELAALVAVIRDRGVPAIFVETTQPTALAEAVAAEVGGSIQVIELHTESLGAPGTPAATLAGMLVEDARLITGALEARWTG